MNTAPFTAQATQMIDRIGTQAHQAVDLWREGGERLGDACGRQWRRSFAQAAPKLSAETRRNAQNARKVVGGYYARGIDLSAAGAETVIDTLVQTAALAVERIAAVAPGRTATH